MKFPPDYRITFRLALAVILAGVGLAAVSAPTSNISATKHNLSAAGPGTFKAQNNTTTSEVCVYCHTPHGKPGTEAVRPLWNRTLSTPSSYTAYSSSSIDATDMGTAQPGNESKLCLSCHDGMLAVNTVSVLGGRTDRTITFQNDSNSGKMPTGLGVNTGFTRNLGTDLRNDHPIGMTYDDDLATADGEMRKPSTSGGLIDIRQHPSTKPTLPLDADGKVQCISCHDPHFDAQKFLRLNRFQQTAQAGSSLNTSNDQICLGCHSRLGAVWGESVHGNSIAADEEYANAAATNRDFPTSPKKKVWEVGCLNCHDTHTVAGSRRLLREGVNSSTTGTGAGLYYQGDTASDASTVSAIENTCYQCHDATTSRILDTTGAPTGTVPNIKYEFVTRSRKMPIVTSAQGSGAAGKEVHDITKAATHGTSASNSGGGADFMERQDTLGRNSSTGGAITSARHVECTDCHNPHRVRRSSLFYGTSANSGEGAKRTHNVGGVNGNVISGALRGTWGVEPDYSGVSTSTIWPELPTIGSAQVKRGDPGDSTSTARSSSYVTREYQVCLKCHSNYANSDTASQYPSLGGYTGSTPTANANGMTKYTNVAAEFSVRATDPPTTGTDQGEESNTSGTGGPCSTDCNPTPSNPGSIPQANNHRSWHPVIWPTGRNRNERGSTSWNNLRYPYLPAEAGLLTMHCSDCHGADGSWTQNNGLSATTGGPNSNVQGPHGSNNPFILKGVWTDSVTPSGAAGSNSSDSICGRCHDPANATSGFAGSSEASHGWEVKETRYCMFCHIAVPHGWKNKAFLVNLNCVQSEGGTGYTSSCTAAGGTDATSEQTIPPYYYRAKLRISSWSVSGSWAKSSCVGESWMSSACGQ